MGKCCRYFSSSIGKKQLMGITGLLLSGFVLTHLMGNFLLFLGPKAFNLYSHALISNPLIVVAELILLAIFLSHLALAALLTRENRKARPVPYHTRKTSGRGSTFASSTMPLSGAILLAFIIYHLIGFKYGTVYTTTYEGVEVRDLYRLLMEYFQSPLQVVLYIIPMLVLGLHLSHGFQSAFKSLGLVHPRYTPCVVRLGHAFAWFVALGFSSLPLWCLYKGSLL